MKVEIPLKKDFPIILLEKIPRRFFFRPSDENVIYATRMHTDVHFSQSIMNKLHHGCQHFFIDIHRGNVREQYGYMFNIVPLSCLKIWRGCKSNYLKNFEIFSKNFTGPNHFAASSESLCCCSGFGSHKKETRVDIINL